MDALAKECIEGPFDLVLRQRTERPLQQYFLTAKGSADIEPWRSLLVKNSPVPWLPIFLFSLRRAAKDLIVRPDVTRDYAAKLCNAGSKVRMLVMPNIGHGRAAQASTMMAVNWMTDRLVHEPPPDDCRK